MSIRELAREIVRTLQARGHTAYWVGGCVRDCLLERDPGDYDIATSARPEEIEALFSKTIPVGRQFGVLLVVTDDHQFQVATFRSESDYQDGRRPERVTFSSPEADAQRRDFTINGLFFDPIANRLLDFVGGEDDLKRRRLRAIGDPDERFAEDHLRLLRAVRLAAQLNFEIEPGTWNALRRRSGGILTVSAERVRDELLKLFMPPHAARGLDLLRESGLLEKILPEVQAGIDCPQSPEFHPEGSVYNHIRKLLEHAPAHASASLMWAGLLHDVGKPVTAARDAQTGQIHFYGHEKAGAEMAERILRRLRFPKRQTDEIVAAVRLHMQFKDALAMRQSTLRRLLLRPTFPLELELHRMDCLGSHGDLERFEFLQAAARKLEEQPGLVPPLLRGSDLLQLGLTPGPSMGRLLAQAREMQLQDELKTRAEALQWARQRLAAEAPDSARARSDSAHG